MYDIKNALILTSLDHQNNFDWTRKLGNASPNWRDAIFNDTILNIIRNFIPVDTRRRFNVYKTSIDVV